MIKYLAILPLIAFAALPAQAQTPISRDMANAYYQQCLQGNDPRISDQTKDMMCSCTAAAMMQNMSVEDVQTMAQQSQAGRNALNKMMINVYAPCIQYPARDYYFGTCINNPQTAQMSSNPQGLCTCLADNVAQHLGQNSQQVFSEILRRNPNITDPMSALTSDREFEQFAQQRLLACVQ